jgi:hypothetical protein
MDEAPVVGVVVGKQDHAVEAHTGPEVAAVAQQELHLVDASAEGQSQGRPVGMARGQPPCAEVGSGCGPAVAEGHVTVHYQVEAAEELELELELETGHEEPNTSN